MQFDIALFQLVAQGRIAFSDYEYSMSLPAQAGDQTQEILFGAAQT
jgi:hypothetical protein